MEDMPICTNMYSTEAFDSRDSKANGYVKGSLHGAVKVWTQEEIDEYNKKLELERESENG